MANIITTMILLLLISTFSYATCRDTTPKFSAILVFGDSTVDSGNNNYINTWLKADFRPYGQDFPGHLPTGRFSNGKLTSDVVATKLGIKDTVPAFLDPDLDDKELITGVNFASAGSGYDDSTTLTTNVIPFSRQMESFKKYIARVKRVVGEKEAANIIAGALVYVSAGTNDWIFNFYDLPFRRLQFDVNGYQDFLQNKIKFFIKELYDLGCRTIIVNGLPPIGCIPVQIEVKLKNPKEFGKCLQDQNSDAQSYNVKLEKLLLQLQPNLPGSKLLYADFYNLLFDIINNPNKYGFVDSKQGCCGGTKSGASILCTRDAPPCQNASQFVFWDCIHPTQSVYEMQANFLEKTIFPKL
ncbi:hypothetical protein K2173_016477 [Erythroxylum novogranatense]|uniref:GDSL esterase/lipase n=1 Tax=Erythroxylum novogranatense TaxID=1862640 RepID=A0AAV8SGZ2_9ROSI|nr:hypothetical protein K2173_016477 [Erythroxylum novogranatense]